VDCDLLAKAGVQRFLNEHTPDTLPHELVVIHVNNKKITGDIGQPLRDAVSMIAMKRHLIDNNTIVPMAFGVIDWEAVGKKMSTTGQQHKIWITKHVSGFCATNKMMYKRGLEDHTQCPCCKIPGIVETTRHQAKPNDPERMLLWKDSVNDLKQWLSEEGYGSNLTGTHHWLFTW